jgi:cell division protein FtsL
MKLNEYIQILLLVLVVIASLSVVTTQHKARKLFIILQQEKNIALQMEIEWGQLQLEQGTLAAPARVESIATQQLKMQVPEKKYIKFIVLDKISSSWAGAKL